MTDIEKRKEDHIEIGLSENVSMEKSTGFDQFSFMHQALPELAFRDISLETAFLGRDIGAPILISSMTGGNDRAETINRHLGEAAQRLRLPMAVGSQRILIEQPKVLNSFKAARKAAPNIPIYGNLGAVQLNNGVEFEHVHRVVDFIQGDGCFLHMNPLQEVVQTEGDTDFRGLLDKIGELADTLDFPVLAKEVGCGIAPEIAVALAKRGVSAIDISGAGGTSWASIEAQRAESPGKRRLGEVFSDWGIPTTESLVLCREALPDFPFIASGGIRNGLDVAKALALGADLVAFAMPLLKPATISTEAVIETIEQILMELRVAMFLIGADDLSSLKTKRHLLKKQKPINF